MANRKLIITLSVLVCGLSLGFIAGQFYAQHKFMQILTQGPSAIRPLVLKRMKAKLDLTSEQLVALEPILNELHVEGTQIRKEAIPKFLKAFQQARSQAEPILNAEQLEIVDAQAKKIEMHLSGQS